MAAAVAFMWISALHISPFVPSTNMNVSNEDGRQARIKEAGESFKKRKKEKKKKRREREHPFHGAKEAVAQADTTDTRRWG